jgi:N-acetylglutamate synthase-like GNAT family acetyltransferase
MGQINIITYDKQYEQQTIDLIVGIQHGEFGIAITAEDQPDLRIVDTFYQQGNGNFWLATDGDRVVGTIALIDIGNRAVSLRKMFVHPDYRGKEKATGQRLMDIVFNWCEARDITAIYLGTVGQFKAAHRFYERNGFVAVDKVNMPASFPAMPLDHMFYAFYFN